MMHYLHVSKKLFMSIFEFLTQKVSLRNQVGELLLWRVVLPAE